MRMRKIETKNHLDTIPMSLCNISETQKTVLKEFLKDLYPANINF